ncbi:hypothetical protein [Chryseobacterium taichungense]|uniref:hypothetical protein n=1 Tax=Chryseobacterium taichungense TaxID=295069 RepID=UPI0028AC0A6D|nr:hypothetical protein [Chryseobacterium taichungense]
MISHQEQKLYDHLTRFCNFAPLPDQLLDLVEHCNLTGEIHEEFPFICYHFHSYSYTKRQYEELCEFHVRLLSKVQHHKMLSDNVSNTLLTLREPLVKSGMPDYEDKNRAYWKEIVETTPEVQGRSEFRKYLVL